MDLKKLEIQREHSCLELTTGKSSYDFSGPILILHPVDLLKSIKIPESHEEKMLLINELDNLKQRVLMSIDGASSLN